MGLNVLLIRVLITQEIKMHIQQMMESLRSDNCSDTLGFNVYNNTVSVLKRTAKMEQSNKTPSVHKEAENVDNKKMKTAKQELLRVIEIQIEHLCNYGWICQFTEEDVKILQYAVDKVKEAIETETWIHGPDMLINDGSVMDPPCNPEDLSIFKDKDEVICWKHLIINPETKSLKSYNGQEWQVGINKCSRISTELTELEQRIKRIVGDFVQVWSMKQRGIPDDEFGHGVCVAVKCKKEHLIGYGIAEAAFTQVYLEQSEFDRVMGPIDYREILENLKKRVSDLENRYTED